MYKQRKHVVIRVLIDIGSFDILCGIYDIYCACVHASVLDVASD